MKAKSYTILAPNKPSEVKEGIPSIDTLRKIIGGWVEVVTLPDGMILAVDEDGISKRLPVNIEATKLATAVLRPGHSIVGTAVLLRRDMLS